MSRPMPEHGTRARYMRGCRCPGCFDANGRYCKAYRNQAHRNGPKRIDPTPVVMRIHYWKRRGYSHSQIAAAAGLARRVIDAHAKQQLKSINPDSARKILAVRLDNTAIPDYLPVDATGTIRRLRALSVLGHQLQNIAAAAGHQAGALSKVLNGHSEHVRGTTANDIARVYEAWQHTPGRDKRTRLRAQREGWHGPLDWDDIDNPDEQPDTDAPELSHKELAQQRLADIVLLASAGNRPEQIAQRLGISAGHVRDRLKAERPTTLLELTA